MRDLANRLRHLDAPLPLTAALQEEVRAQVVLGGTALVFVAKLAQEVDIIQPGAHHGVGAQFRRDNARIGDAQVVSLRQQVEVVVHRLVHGLLDGHLIRKRGRRLGGETSGREN